MDGHHANTAGEYLGACVFFEVLFGKASSGTRSAERAQARGSEGPAGNRPPGGRRGGEVAYSFRPTIMNDIRMSFSALIVPPAADSRSIS